MSSRFHNKYHRHNHHTVTTLDSRYPDAGHDPIASPDAPFMGAFVMLGTLSATGIPAGNVSGFSSEIPPGPGGVFTSYPTALIATALSGTNNGVAVQAIGDVSVTGSISAANICFTGNVTSTYDTPVETTGEFLSVNVNGTTKLIRLWSL